MRATALNIVSLFRKKGLELSTSQILSHLDNDYSNLKEKLSSFPSNSDLRAKISMKHRKILHHLNKLVKSGVLAVVKHGEKGEKFFNLDLSDNEEILELAPEYKKRVLISKPLLPAMPIEGYEQKGIVVKYEPATFVDRLTSMIVFSDKLKDKNELHKLLIENFFPVTNDVIHLENFESLINQADLSGFLEEIDRECEDYGKILSLSVELSKVREKSNLISILRILDRNRLEKINLIYSIDSNPESNSGLLNEIIQAYSKNKINLYIKNKGFHSAPYFVGKAGPYCFINSEWSLAEELRMESLCLACSQSCVILDINRLSGEKGFSNEKFLQLMLNISKSMLSANSIQRRKSEDYFRSVNYLNGQHRAEFLTLSRNYIRFWNFGLYDPGTDPEKILIMIGEAKKRINQFSTAEETIYKSCGMTTRFKLALSPAFETATLLSPAQYERLRIEDISDFSGKKVKKILSEREETSQIFDGGDEMTVHYSGPMDPESILRQISLIISDYKIPLFSFNFHNIRGNLKLTPFLK